MADMSYLKDMPIAVLGGGVLMYQWLSVRELLGCALMFIAIILAQLDPKKLRRSK